MTTLRPLKVFTVRAHLGGNARGQVRAVVAAPTAAAAARAFGVSAHQLRTYGSETGNALQIKVAMSDPGAVFFGPTAQHIADASGYTRWEPTTWDGTPIGSPSTKETPMAKPVEYGIGGYAYKCTKCGTVIRSILPYVTDPAPFHRHEMVFTEDPLAGFSAGITPCGPLAPLEG